MCRSIIRRSICTEKQYLSRICAQLSPSSRRIHCGVQPHPPGSSTNNHRVKCFVPQLSLVLSLALSLQEQKHPDFQGFLESWLKYVSDWTRSNQLFPSAFCVVLPLLPPLANGVKFLTSPKAPRPITFKISKSSLRSRICFTLPVNGLAAGRERGKKDKERVRRLL